MPSDWWREYLDQLNTEGAAKVREAPTPWQALARLSGRMAGVTPTLSDALYDLSADVQALERRVEDHTYDLRKRIEQQEEVIGRLTDVVHEEALQRNTWMDYLVEEEAERLRAATAAVRGG